MLRARRGIKNGEFIVSQVGAKRRPLSDRQTFGFVDTNRRRKIHVELGMIMVILKPDIDVMLGIINSPRLGPNGGLQKIADLLGKKLIAENNSTKMPFRHEYYPRRRMLAEKD